MHNAHAQVVANGVVSGDMHLRILGERAFVYDTSHELVSMLLRFDRLRAATRGEYWNAYRPFEPPHVMRAFECVFLRGGRCQLTRLPAHLDLHARWPPSSSSTSMPPGAKVSPQGSYHGAAEVGGEDADVEAVEDVCKVCFDYDALYASPPLRRGEGPRRFPSTPNRTW